MKLILATKAYHKMGELTREIPDFAIVTGETETDYIGHWARHLVLFVEVHFPKQTSRLVTVEDARLLQMAFPKLEVNRV